MKRPVLFVRLLISVLVVGGLQPEAFATVKSSKTNAYTVLAPPAGVSASKVNAYTVLAPPAGVTVSKVNAYVVLAPASTPTKQPNVFIMTKNRFTPLLTPLEATGSVNKEWRDVASEVILEMNLSLPEISSTQERFAPLR